jgi:NADH-quinone oxidoreductase E subunit
MALMTQQERLRDELVQLVERFGSDRSALLPILQEVQKRYFHISDYAMQLIANQLEIHPVEVHSVVSFYSFLDFEPKGRFIIRLCQTICCNMAGKDRVVRQLENDLGIQFGQTTTDGKFTLEFANCIGMCDQGPALLVNDQVYTRVTPEMVHQIIENCRKVFGLHATQPAEL